MPAGLQIFNDAGTVQIDESYQNYGLTQITSLTQTATGVGSNRYQLVVAGTESLLVACRAYSLMPIPLHSYFDGTFWYFNWTFSTVGPTITETVYFYIFDVLPVTGFSNMGLEVFDAAGKRVFHSDCAPMRVAGVQACDSPFYGTPGRSYVPLIMRNSAHGVFVAGSGYRIACYSNRVSGSDIVSDLTTPGNTFGATGAYPQQGYYAAIDITGF